jgi:hypothetical protein
VTEAGQPTEAWHGLRTAFRSSGLSLPDGLVARFPRLMPIHQWAWGTDAYEPINEYLFKAYRSWMQGDRLPRLRICHAGHGINSFMLTLHVATDRMAVFAQVPWGGHYTGNAEGASHFSNLLQEASNLLDLADGLPVWPDGAAVALIRSRPRGINSVGALHERVSDRAAQREWLIRHRSEDGAVAEARRLVKALGTVKNEP